MLSLLWTTLCLQACLYTCQTEARHVVSREEPSIDLLVPVNVTKHHRRTARSTDESLEEGSGSHYLHPIVPLPRGLGKIMERMQIARDVDETEGETDEASRESLESRPITTEHPDAETFSVEEGSGGFEDDSPRSAAVIAHIGDDIFTKEEGMEGVFKDLVGDENQQVDDQNKHDNRISVLGNDGSIRINEDEETRINDDAHEEGQEEGSGDVDVILTGINPSNEESKTEETDAEDEDESQSEEKATTDDSEPTGTEKPEERQPDVADHLLNLHASSKESPDGKDAGPEVETSNENEADTEIKNDKSTESSEIDAEIIDIENLNANPPDDNNEKDSAERSGRLVVEPNETNERNEETEATEATPKIDSPEISDDDVGKAEETTEKAGHSHENEGGEDEKIDSEENIKVVPGGESTDVEDSSEGPSIKISTPVSTNIDEEKLCSEEESCPTQPPVAKSEENEESGETQETKTESCENSENCLAKIEETTPIPDVVKDLSVETPDEPTEKPIVPIDDKLIIAGVACAEEDECSPTPSTSIPPEDDRLIIPVVCTDLEKCTPTTAKPGDDDNVTKAGVVSQPSSPDSLEPIPESTPSEIEYPTEKEAEILVPAEEEKITPVTEEEVKATDAGPSKESSAKIVEATLFGKGPEDGEGSDTKKLSAYIFIGLIGVCFIGLVLFLVIRNRIRFRDRMVVSLEDSEKALMSLGKYKDDSDDNNVKNNEITPLVIKPNSQINKFEKNPNFSSPKNLNTTANEKNIEKDNVLKSTQAIIDDEVEAEKKSLEEEKKSLEEDKGGDEDKNRVDVSAPEKLIVHTHLDQDSIPRKPVIVTRNGNGYHAVAQDPV